jgi:hypothetical protein
MGSIVSSPVTQQSQTTQKTANVESNEVENKTAEIRETIPAETTVVTDIAPVTESKSENVDQQVNSTPINEVSTKEPDVVLERYIEPSGTKVEVAPVEVAPSADVVKKHKNKKHKKQH